MKRRIKPSSSGIPAKLAAACALLLSGAATAQAADLAALVSSNSGPYAEAYAAFRAELKIPLDFYDASAPGFAPPEDIIYAVAFGARAAALEYPQGTLLVYALAPVTGRGANWHEISMLPAPAAAIKAYKGLQPGLKRLAVFWAVYPGERYLEELRTEGEKAGVEILSVKLKDPDYFPERLRRLMGKMDAFWLMPDPALITQASLTILANFSCANAIPFYAPTYALVLNGATASYAPDFSEAGLAAARAITLMHGGGRLPPVSYAEKATLRVNERLLDKCRWPLTK